MERRSRLKEEHSLMLNLVVEKGASKDHDRSGSNITQLRMGTQIEYVQRFGLNLGLRKSLKYIRHVFSFSFSLIVVAFPSSTRVSLTLVITPYRSIVTAIHPSHFSIIWSPFLSFIISFSNLFSNFYHNSKTNLNLSLTLTSTCTIFTWAYSPALVFLLNI